MLKKRIVSCVVTVLMLASCMFCSTITALGSDIVENVFNDTFDEGSDFTDNYLYNSSSKVSLFKKTSGLKEGIDGAAVSALAVSEVGSAGEVIYYAPQGIKSFQFDSRFSAGSINTAWDATVHCNYSFGSTITSDHLSKSPVAYVSSDGATWLNPYNTSNDYTVDLTWGTATYDNWNHFLYKSTNIPENIKYLKIAFPAMKFAGSSQIDNLSVTYNYEPTVQAESRSFTDDFNKGVTAETVSGSTGTYYRTDGLYYESANVTGFLKTNDLQENAKYKETPYKYAALTSSITKDSTGSAYITYYAPGGITDFNFVSRFNGSNTPTANVWPDSLLVNTEGNVSANKQQLLYVSQDGTNWINPYNNRNGYKISYYWPADDEKDSVYDGWTHMRCKSVSVPDGIKYLKIVFPYAQWVGATQIDDLVINYKYYPHEEQDFAITDSSSSNSGSAYTYTANVTSGKTQNAVMIIAYYKGDVLVGAAVSGSKSLAAGGTDVFTATASVSDIPDSAKAFFWNDMNNLMPVTEAVPVSLN